MNQQVQSPGQCPVHGYEFVWQPPGMSRRTGQPYHGFWKCPDRQCRMRPGQPAPFSQAPPNGGFTPPPPQQNQVIRTGRSDSRPAEDVAGKVRHGLVVAMIGAGWEWERIQSELPRYVAVVMGSAVPEPQDADLSF